jgi:hypothetical protein
MANLDLLVRSAASHHIGNQSLDNLTALILGFGE